LKYTSQQFRVACVALFQVPDLTVSILRPSSETSFRSMGVQSKGYLYAVSEKMANNSGPGRFKNIGSVYHNRATQWLYRPGL